MSDWYSLSDIWQNITDTLQLVYWYSLAAAADSDSASDWKTIGAILGAVGGALLLLAGVKLCCRRAKRRRTGRDNAVLPTHSPEPSCEPTQSPEPEPSWEPAHFSEASLVPAYIPEPSLDTRQTSQSSVDQSMALQKARVSGIDLMPASCSEMTECGHIRQIEFVQVGGTAKDTAGDGHDSLHTSEAPLAQSGRERHTQELDTTDRDASWLGGNDAEVKLEHEWAELHDTLPTE